MIKKVCLIIFAAILAFSLVAVVWNARDSTEMKILPLLANHSIYWGMSPTQLNKQLGSHTNVISSYCDTDKTVYTYKTTVLGYNATMICYFVNNRQLTQVDIEWDAEVNDLFETVFDCLLSFYCANEDFFCKPKEYIDKDSFKASIGIDNGITGVFYSIYGTNEKLQISCINNA